MNFEQYLQSKKIDAAAFEKGEQSLFAEWKIEFAQMHPNSFTVQKLNLINPIRRKYLLKEIPPATPPASEPVNAPAPSAAPKVARPVFKPKPKIS